MATTSASTSKPVKTVSKAGSACQYCQMSFKKLEHLQRHMRTHTQDRPYSCIAEGCGKAFARQDTLNRHARLHIRDAEEGNEKGRVPRRRSKSISESSSAVNRRSSTSPYPNAARRDSDVSSAASITARNSVRGFNVLSNTIPEHAAASAYLPCSTSVPSTSRFSTMDLLGIAYPDSDHSSPAGSISPLPSLNELYGAQSLDGASAFDRRAHMSNSLFSGRYLVNNSMSLQTHQLDFASPPAQAASPWSDDGLSISSNEYARTPSLVGSGLSSMASSYDPAMVDRSPMMHQHNRYPSGLDYSAQSPTFDGQNGMIPNMEGKMAGTDVYSSTDLMLQQLFQAADIQSNAASSPQNSISALSPQFRNPPMSPAFGMMDFATSPMATSAYTHSSAAPAPSFASAPFSCSAPTNNSSFMTHSNKDAPRFLSASVISQFANTNTGVAPQAISPSSHDSSRNSLGLQDMLTPSSMPARMSNTPMVSNNSLYPMLPFERNYSAQNLDFSWLTDSSIIDTPDWMRDS